MFNGRRGPQGKVLRAHGVPNVTMDSELNHKKQVPCLFYYQVERNFPLPFAESKAKPLHLWVFKGSKMWEEILKSYDSYFFSFKKIAFYFWKALWSIDTSLPWKLQGQRNVSPLESILLRSNVEYAKIMCFGFIRDITVVVILSV